MRHHSERVPGKNYRSFGGEPLYRHVVRTLLACSEIDAVLIDTDSRVILEDAAREFPSVVLHERPEHLRDGALPMNEVLANSIRQVPAELYLQTHSTNPLLSVGTVGRAIRELMARYPERDSLFSVTRLQTRLWDARSRPLNHDPSQLLRTQDLPPVFEENSCIFLFSGEQLRSTGNRIGAAPILFEMDRLEAVDIDEEADFVMAECLYAALRAAEATA